MFLDPIGRPTFFLFFIGAEEVGAKAEGAGGGLGELKELGCEYKVNSGEFGATIIGKSRKTSGEREAMIIGGGRKVSEESGTTIIDTGRVAEVTEGNAEDESILLAQSRF